MAYESIEDTYQKILAAEKLLFEETTTVGKIDSIRTLLKNIDPRIDETLNLLIKTLSNLEKLYKLEIIELTAENLPQETEEQKNRKKRILLFIRTWNQLKSEVNRVKTQLEQSQLNNKNSKENKMETFEKIASGAKGPFGLITLAAVVIAGVVLYTNFANKNVNLPKQNTSPPATSKPKIKVIVVEGKQIPLSEIFIGTGPDCDSPHYHAKNEVSVKALDGSIIQDPGSCGFGKVKETPVIEVQ